MLQETNLSACKERAKILLRFDINVVSNEVFPIISHVFFSNPFIIQRDEAGNTQLLNILESRKNYNIAIKQMEEAIDKVDNYYNFTILVTPPYKLAFLKHTKEYLDKEDFSTFLINAWTEDEHANSNVNVSKRELVGYFKKAIKENIMEKEELDIYSRLDEVVTVYRGVTSYNKNNIKTLSWTLDKEKAKWFAHRFDEEGKVYVAKINKEDILAYCDRRNEKEIILDYTKLYDIEVVDE